MDIFKKVKDQVTARQAAERYGLRVTRNGMACCPFHKDKHPSMKIDRRYYCFGCGVTGDAVDLAAALLHLPIKEAAATLASDFNIDLSKPLSKHESVHPAGNRHRNPAIRPAHRNAETSWRASAIRTVSDYRELLKDREKKYAPPDPDVAEWNPLFCEALERKPEIEQLLDELVQCDSEETLKDHYGKEVERIDRELRMALPSVSKRSEHRKCCRFSDGR